MNGTLRSELTAGICMLTHKQIWAAFDGIAEAQGISVSALSKRAGLDATAFNPSKRISQAAVNDGHPRKHFPRFSPQPAWI